MIEESNRAPSLSQERDINNDKPLEGGGVHTLGLSRSGDKVNKIKELSKSDQDKSGQTAHRGGSTTAKVLEFLETTTGQFSVRDVTQNLSGQIVTNRDTIRRILYRLWKEGVIEKCTNLDGVYRKIDRDTEDIELSDEEVPEYPILLPLGLNRLVQIHSKNLIVVAGAPNSGKTAFLLNTAISNMYEKEIAYFSSEMGQKELILRLKKFGKPLSEWKKNCHFIERSSNFSDVIRPDIINIVDYLEIGDEFYKIGADLKAIFDRLKGGVAVVAIQKARGILLGRGGDFTLEKPRLALSMDVGKIIITKAKNWKTGINPNGLALRFSLVQGCHFHVVQDWGRLG